ncbi:oxidoreductase-like protein [Mollisia scopiformis]|uniref:Oxidoreductase-like protein n=1 Tax=Mollisia scopiformis TaxID=149040 RepID=A0A194X6J3_MOLSC|nr:oxidoreductase-like protein [Mollisia scopiformis]KUJ15422.1 oxidoreductase-like protein [Mollisia scopiformis]
MAAVALPPQPLNDESSLKAALEAQEYLQSRLTATSEAPAFRSIPIIDLTKSFSSSLVDRRAVAEQINSACTDVGFFYITGHGIATGVCEDVLKLAHRFFHELPQPSKDAMLCNDYFRGYEPAAFTSVNNFESKETKEAFNWGYESGLDPTGGDGKYVELDGKPEASVNLWPSEKELPGFYAGIAKYYGEVLQLSRHLFRLFALSLALPEDYFDPLMTHPGGIARLIRYPPATNPKPLSELNEDEEIGLGAHTDYECFTLLLQDANQGLEILSPDNHWISAAPVEGGIVVNVADFLMRWTNGIYKSTVHRVVNRTDKERYSIPLFFSINYDETVETLPSCVKEGNPSKFPPITAGRYILDRLNLTVKTGKY